jgi:hypothetical protein
MTMSEANKAGSDLRTESILQWSTVEDHPTSLSSSTSGMRRGFTRQWKLWMLLPYLGRKGAYERSSATNLKISASEGWKGILALTWFLDVPVSKY